jgi:redox-sensitive bicupin YhaK (pirin superfamily)
VLRPGEFQRMSAGTGITHSEFNPSNSEPAHLYQIWLTPAQDGIEPSYEQKRFDDEGMLNRLQLVASPDAQSGSLRIHQDARIYLAKLDPAVQISHDLQSGRHVWLQVLRGEVTVNGQPLVVSDGAAISEESQIEIVSTTSAELMLFDLS